MNKKGLYQKVDGQFGTLPRHALPQISKKQIPRFVRELQSRGIETRAVKIPADRIVPLQAHANKDKLRKMQPDVDKFDRDVFLISKENCLLDGHHRWLILKGSNKDRPVRTIKVNLPIKQLLRFAKKFDGSHREGIA